MRWPPVSDQQGGLILAKLVQTDFNYRYFYFSPLNMNTHIKLRHTPPAV